MLQSLVDILGSLDIYVGNYPFYAFLVDRNSEVVWKNSYMKSKFPPDMEWSLSNLQSEADTPGHLFDDENIKQGIAQKSIIKRKLEPGGSEVYLEFLNLPVRDKRGRLEGILNIGFDVTEAQLQQDKLREKEKLYTSIIDSSVDAIIFVDLENRIVSWNKGAEEIFGYSQNEIVGKSVLQLVPKELIEVGELYYIQQELEKNGFIKEFETQRLTRDGKSIFVDLTRTMIYDEEGNPLGSSEILKDNSKKKELEFGLLRTIVELSKINELNEILYATYDQNEIYRLILVAITAGEGLRFNRAFLVLIDHQEQCLKGHLAIGPSNEDEAAVIWSGMKGRHGALKEIIQQYRIDVWGGDHRVNEIVEQIKIPLTQSDDIMVKATNNRRTYYIKDGQIVQPRKGDSELNNAELIELLEHDSFVIVPLYTKKEPLGVIIADNRITRREISTEDIESLKLFAVQASTAIENTRLYKSLEDRILELQEVNRRLKENQDKLVKSERLAAIGEMSAIIAHEIRNPLVSIGGFANLIEKNISQMEKVERYAKIIREQVLHMEFILSNLLNLANPPKLQRKLIDINQIIHQVGLVLQTSLERRNIAFKLNLACFEGQIMGDEKLLHQALLNLIKNAIEAVEAKGGSGEISVTTKCDGNIAEVILTDNGPGIESQHLDKIFDAFFTTRPGGTGLGLPIVKRIIEDHKGEIAVKSIPREGTTFYLKFPIHKDSGDLS